MRRGKMRLGWMAGGLTISAAALMLFWLDHFVRVTLQVQAHEMVDRWIAQLERSVPALDAALAGAPLTAAQRDRLHASKDASALRGLRLFDATGTRIFDSTAAPARSRYAGGAVQPRLTAPRPLPLPADARAQAVLLSGAPELSLQRDAAGSPRLTAYLPVGGTQGAEAAPAGVAALSLDAAATAAVLRQGLTPWAGIAGGVTLLLLVGPWLLLARRRQQGSGRALLEQSRRDDLTDLLNRRGLRIALREAARETAPGGGLTLFHLDIDTFKAVNESAGHQVGDLVLRGLAERLDRHVGPRGWVARAGGDEFVVCLGPPLREAEAEREAKALRTLLAAPLQIAGRRFRLDASIGIAHWSAVTPATAARGPESALQDAGIALSLAKRPERGPIVTCTAQMRADRLRDVALAESARAGLEAGAFTAHFQPVFAVRGGCDAGGGDGAPGRPGAAEPATTTVVDVVGFEALLRWQHPEQGLLRPDAFLKPCEAAGLSDALLAVIFEEVAELGRALAETPLGPVPVSVNLSAGQLNRPGCAARIRGLAEAAGLDPRAVRLEILESTLLQDSDSPVADNIAALHAAGFPLDLDDFGTGHTAIAALRRFPVSRIKLDRALVAGIDGDPGLKALTHGLLDLGRTLGLEMLAEGVETAQETHLLAQIGCGPFRGYYLHAPMSREACIDWAMGLAQAPRRVPASRGTGHRAPRAPGQTPGAGSAGSPRLVGSRGGARRPPEAGQAPGKTPGRTRAAAQGACAKTRPN